MLLALRSGPRDFRDQYRTSECWSQKARMLEADQRPVEVPLNPAALAVVKGWYGIRKVNSPRNRNKSSPACWGAQEHAPSTRSR
jgi:hypothetical protein